MASSIIPMQNEIKSVQFTGTTNASGRIEGGLSDFGITNGTAIISAYIARGSYGIRRRVDIYNYGNAGYGLTFYNSPDTATPIASASVTCTIYYV